VNEARDEVTLANLQQQRAQITSDHYAQLLDSSDSISKLEQQAFYRALELLWQVIGEGDRYVNEQKPWSLKKTDPARMGTVLYVLAETIRHLAVLIQPFMPQACSRLLDFLAVPDDDRIFAALVSRKLAPGTRLPAPEGLFPRYAEEGEGVAAPA